MVLPLPRPFNVTWTLGQLRASSLGVPYPFRGRRRVQRALHLGGEGVVEFDFSQPAQGLRARFLAPPGPLAVAGQGDAHGQTGAARALGFLWGLDDDLNPWYARLRGDPLLGRLVGRYRGLRLLRTPSLHEALVVAVLGQQVSMAAALAIRRRFLETLGDRVTAGGRVYTTYPRPAQLLAAGPTGRNPRGGAVDRGDGPHAGAGPSGLFPPGRPRVAGRSPAPPGAPRPPGGRGAGGARQRLGRVPELRRLPALVEFAGRRVRAERDSRG